MTYNTKANIEKNCVGLSMCSVPWLPEVFSLSERPHSVALREKKPLASRVCVVVKTQVYGSGGSKFEYW